MSEINTILLCLQPFLKGSVFHQLSLITEALLMMQGRITMLGISRWTAKGGSYRTIQRFFLTPVHWPALNWALIKPRLRDAQGPIIIAGDATTVTKSGKQTFGLGRFFSSIYARPVPGIAFQTLSLIEVASRQSWPILMEQIAPTPPHKKSPKTKKKDHQKSETSARPAYWVKE